MAAPTETAAQPMNRRTTAKAATRRKVMEAGAALFEAVGYEAATIRAIAAAAGMSTGAVFANFVGKADLYHAIHGHGPVTTEGGRRLLAALKRALVEIDAEIEQRQTGGNDEAWLALQGVSDEAHLAIAMASKKPGAA